MSFTLIMTCESLISAISDLEAFLKLECNDDSVLNAFTLIKDAVTSISNARLSYNVHAVPDFMAFAQDVGDTSIKSSDCGSVLPAKTNNLRTLVNNIALSSVFSQKCSTFPSSKLTTNEAVDRGHSGAEDEYSNTNFARTPLPKSNLLMIDENNGWNIGKSRRNVPIDEENLDFYMKQLGRNWHLDMIALSNLPSILRDGPLFSMGTYLLNPVGSKIDPKFNYLVAPVLKDLQDVYLSNPYHNALHGSMVGHMSVLLSKCICSERRFTHYEEFAYILAALGHDAGHPGKTNAFLSSTGSPLALIYNDNSILENYHASLIFHIMRLHVQFFNLIPPKEWENLRKRMIQLVLSTDMKTHFTHIDNVKNRRLSGEFDMSNDDDFWLLMVLCIKTADIGHNFLPWVDHISWTYVLFEEFYLQGDEERFLSMPLLLFFDRSKAADIPNSQLGFFQGFTKPLLNELTMFETSSKFISNVLSANAANNLECWKNSTSKKIEEIIEELDRANETIVIEDAFIDAH